MATPKSHAADQPAIVVPPAQLPGTLVLTFRIFVAFGLLALVAGLLGFMTERMWIAYLINFCFWSGLAQAGVVFSAAYRLTNGRWGETIRRVAEGFVLFIPASVVLFLVTFLGRHYLWPWIEDPIEAKAPWLNEPFFFLRVSVYFLALSALSLRYVYLSARPDVGLLKEKNLLPDSLWARSLTAGWRGYDEELAASQAKLTTLVPIVLVAYAVIYTFVGFDVVMSLDPHWYSTIYGWLYMVHAFDAGVAATIIVAILARRYFDLRDHVSTKQFYDVSRLLMGICMLAGGFYWGQYLTIWYGNLGEEIERLILRFSHDPWPPFQWGVILLLYFFPIAVFLSRAVKQWPRALILIASIILAANWFYHFIEVAPAVWTEQSVPLGIVEALVTLGFLGGVGLAWLTYARVVPLVPVAASQGQSHHHS